MSRFRRSVEVGMMFHIAFPHLTVDQNIGFGLEDWLIKAEQRIHELLDLIGYITWV